jgi:hypothetical protein
MNTIGVKSLPLKVERSGTFGEYEVTGRRYVGDVRWNVKVWLTGHPRDWLGGTVKSGKCDLNILSEVQRKALKDVITKWEA